jgi:NAD-dependent SIR2 family protein deacetylase
MGWVVRSPSLPPLPADFVASYATSFESLREFYRQSKRLLVLTGAGISTDSGIPDYRSPGRPAANPIMYHQFVRSQEVRKRYWARGMMGYLNFASCSPNAGHVAVANMQQDGPCHAVITQNVDGYHQDAGATNVLEIHGNLHRVVCLDCGSRGPRAELQERMIALNRSFYDLLMAQAEGMKRFPDEGVEKEVMKPDGDIDLAVDDFSGFILPRCFRCDSVNVEPDIVFMGGNIKPQVTETATRLVEESDSLLVIGSTLVVYSSYRLTKLAKSLHQPLAIINRGQTRSDPLADIKLEESIAPLLQQLLS